MGSPRRRRAESLQSNSYQERDWLREQGSGGQRDLHAIDDLGAFDAKFVAAQRYHLKLTLRPTRGRPAGRDLCL